MAEYGECCEGADIWFDREVCPEPCDTMHQRCTECGEPVEYCSFTALEPPRRQEIGYLCHRGPHFCFHADPDEGGACRSKSVARIYVETDLNSLNLPDGEFEEMVDVAAHSLGEHLDFWRENA